jgi:hypothetical protein
MSPSYSTPTLHVIGKNDIIVIEERSKTLVEVSDNKRVEEHDGGVLIIHSLGCLLLLLIFCPPGHFVPSKANWRYFFRDYLLDPLGNVPSPGPSSSLATNSGVSTPVNLPTSASNQAMEL